MEYKQFAIDDCKFDDGTRTVEGLASFFGNIDQGNDMVLPGAFTKTLKQNKTLPMLWQHDTAMPIGVWDQLTETEKGLHVKGTIIDTTAGLDAYKLAKGGAVKGLSIGYSTKKYEIDKDKGTRKLIELDLFETSLVTFPMNRKATITRVKSENGTFMTEREFEQVLRDVGLSQREAKTVIAHGYRALIQRDAGDELNPEQIAELSALFARFKTLTQ